MRAVQTIAAAARGAGHVDAWPAGLAATAASSGAAIRRYRGPHCAPPVEGTTSSAPATISPPAAARYDAEREPRPTVTAEIRRVDFDVLTVSNAIAARGLPGDVYRAATVRTGKLVR